MKTHDKLQRLGKGWERMGEIRKEIRTTIGKLACCTALNP